MQNTIKFIKTATEFDTKHFINEHKMQVIHSSTIRLNSLSGCQNIFFFILFACLIESHILILSAVVAAIFYGALEKKCRNKEMK